MHVSKEYRPKLDDIATPYIFIEYGDKEFDYRLLGPKKQKVVKSRDIVFHEYNTMEDLEKNVSCPELTYKGIIDLTPEQTSLEGATDEVEIHNQEQETKIEEPAIRKEDNGDDGDIGRVKQGEHTHTLKGPPLRRTTRER